MKRRSYLARYLGLLFCALLAFTGPARATKTQSKITRSTRAEWHGLIPGQSTREDVIRELGECPRPNKYCEFNLPDEDVYITLSGARTCPGLQEDVILLIERQLVKRASWSSLNLDERDFKKHNPKWMRRVNYEGYLDQRLGLGLKVFQKQIFALVYFPVPGDRAKCANYFKDLKSLVEPFFEHAPLVNLYCPESAVPVGEVLTIRAWYASGLSTVVAWNVSAGKIVEGQGRRKMKLDTSGVNVDTIEITVERADSLAHTSIASCVVKLIRQG